MCDKNNNQYNEFIDSLKEMINDENDLSSDIKANILEKIDETMSDMGELDELEKLRYRNILTIGEYIVDHYKKQN